MENNLDSIYIKNLLLGFWRDDWTFAIATFFTWLPFSFFFNLIYTSFFERYFFLYPTFFEKLFFIICLEIASIIFYVAIDYVFSRTKIAGRSGAYKKSSHKKIKIDGTLQYEFYEESITWKEVAKEYFNWTIFYMIAIWILWWFMSSTF